jgi:hypothetical protein
MVAELIVSRRNFQLSITDSTHEEQDTLPRPVGVWGM